MNMIRNKASEREEIEALLPWHAAGTLSRRDAHKVEQALQSDADLATQYATVRQDLMNLHEAHLDRLRHAHPGYRIADYVPSSTVNPNWCSESEALSRGSVSKIVLPARLTVD